MMNHISHKENVETRERIKKDTKKCHILRKLTSHVINNDWIKAEKELVPASAVHILKKELELLPYKHIKEEISIIKGIVYRDR